MKKKLITNKKLLLWKFIIQSYAIYRVEIDNNVNVYLSPTNIAIYSSQRWAKEEEHNLPLRVILR